MIMKEQGGRGLKYCGLGDILTGLHEVVARMITRVLDVF